MCSKWLIKVTATEKLFYITKCGVQGTLIKLSKKIQFLIFKFRQQSSQSAMLHIRN